MRYVPVISSSGKPLMPCHPARARILIKKKRAKPGFKKGIFYIRLVDREDGNVQPIVVGIDPGSKKEGITVQSAKHTYLNIQADAVTNVKKAVETRKNMRRTRRSRNTPCRKNKKNRNKGNSLAPSTKARWQWKFRMCNWLDKLYPISSYVVEDIRANTKPNKSKWNTSFSPLEVGKNWFYDKLRTLGKVHLRSGYETKRLRDKFGLKKTSKKLSEVFEAHCVDSWVLSKSIVKGRTTPNNKDLLCVTPLIFHRRQLHKLEPAKGGKRNRYDYNIYFNLQ